MIQGDPPIVRDTRDRLKALGAGRGPIIVGPWLSEIGFELLYWIPFLRWACAFAKLRRDDLWIVSRGGCRSWYADIGAHYVDVFDFYTPEQFRAGNARRIAEQAHRALSLGLREGLTSTKQHTLTAFDRDILGRVNLPNARVLHPSTMYGVFRSFWRRQTPSLYDQITAPTRLRTATRAEGLPAAYVAAKFYASAACSQSPLHAQMVNAIVRATVKTTDVVLLHTGTKFDEHGEFAIEPHPRVHRVAMDPATNLETQTAVLAGASGFVGTYGGFAYLAPFLGVPTRTFYAQANFRKDHRRVIDQVCATKLRTKFSVELIDGGLAQKAQRRRVRYAA